MGIETPKRKKKLTRFLEGKNSDQSNYKKPLSIFVGIITRALALFLITQLTGKQFLLRLQEEKRQQKKTNLSPGPTPDPTYFYFCYFVLVFLKFFVLILKDGEKKKVG